MRGAHTPHTPLAILALAVARRGTPRNGWYSTLAGIHRLIQRRGLSLAFWLAMEKWTRNEPKQVQKERQRESVSEFNANTIAVENRMRTKRMKRLLCDCDERNV